MVGQSDPFFRILRAYMAEHGLKASRQRDLIAEVFFQAGGHLRVDELLHKVRELDPRVSQATVYRAMKLLADCGLASVRTFHDGQTRYERRDAHGEHHDHLICVRCDKIIEFVDEHIERLQDGAAERHGFMVTDHKLELYGECQACRERANDDAEPA